jgi:hypothetical protein
LRVPPRKKQAAIVGRGSLPNALIYRSQSHQRFNPTKESALTDELKKVYEGASLRHRYFDSKTPCDLFRGQSKAEEKNGMSLLHPNPGFTRADKSVRIADVKIVERDGNKFVLGCRSTSGDYRGISTFDKKNPALRGFSWHKLPKDTDIPEALAVTQDSALKDKANHYTIAPKDDMTLELFLVWLSALSDKMTKES